jgi:hypothetical protein
LNVALDEGTVTAGTPVNLTASINDTRYSSDNGTEPTHNIAAAEYYIDTPYWVTTTVPISIPMTAVDGTFNNPVEAVQGTVDTTGMSPGQHILFVRGQDANGSWGAVSAVFLEIIDAAPTASFLSSSPDELGTTTVFTNTSTGTELSFAWNFGDGSAISHETDPSHLYAAEGLFTVTLTATNTLGEDVFVGLVQIDDIQTAWSLFMPVMAKSDPPVANKPE